ncbi:hypothetical protein BJY04DRAFT_222770 [Aspergillus karnatakaensis]|uniref:phosphotransferase family protein n=1 Tax=Aspergillus karnatakaensis TaxID=1810916 RepID=UPI003CCCE634
MADSEMTYGAVSDMSMADGAVSDAPMADSAMPDTVSPDTAIPSIEVPDTTIPWPAMPAKEKPTGESQEAIHGAGSSSSYSNGCPFGTQPDYGYRFNQVLRVLDQSQLPVLANSIFKQVYPHEATDDVLPTIGDHSKGAFNMMFPITFPNGVKWALRIPAVGWEGCWDEAAASNMLTEINTMKMLKRETTIPLPEVIAYSVSLDTPLRTPYFIMNYIDGIPGHKIWFEAELVWSEEKGYLVRDYDGQKLRQLKMLDGIAAAMVQLGKYTYPTSGTPLFDDNGYRTPKVTGPWRRLDEHAGSKNDDDHEVVFAEFPPSPNPHHWNRCLLEKYPRSGIGHAVDRILWHIINWIPDPSDMDPFVLAHPDFNLQKFLCADDGTLLAIIDWDGKTAVPRSRGNEKYPGWLCSDFTLEMKMAEQDGTISITPLEQTRFFRRFYRNKLARYKKRENRGRMEPILKYKLPGLALVTEGIEYAHFDAHFRLHTLMELLNLAWEASGVEDPPSFDDLIKAFSVKEIDRDLKKR